MNSTEPNNMTTETTPSIPDRFVFIDLQHRPYMVTKTSNGYWLCYLNADGQFVTLRPIPERKEVKEMLQLRISKKDEDLYLEKAGLRRQNDHA